MKRKKSGYDRREDRRKRDGDMTAHLHRVNVPGGIKEDGFLLKSIDTAPRMATGKKKDLQGMVEGAPQGTLRTIAMQNNGFAGSGGRS